MKWTLKRNDAVLITGYPINVREKIEELLEDELGIFISLQEDGEEGGIYLHSEYGEAMTDEEYNFVNTAGFNDDPTGPTKEIIEKILNVTLLFH